MLLCGNALSGPQNWSGPLPISGMGLLSRQHFDPENSSISLPLLPIFHPKQTGLICIAPAPKLPNNSNNSLQPTLNCSMSLFRTRCKWELSTLPASRDRLRFLENSLENPDRKPLIELDDGKIGTRNPQKFDGKNHGKTGYVRCSPTNQSIESKRFLGQFHGIFPGIFPWIFWAFPPLLGAQDLILLQELLHEAFQVLQGNHGELKEMSKMEHIDSICFWWTCFDVFGGFNPTPLKKNWW